MIAFHREPDGMHVTASAAERALLVDLTGQLIAMLEGEIERDPLAERLFPVAYTDEPEAQAEYRRFTFDDLRAQKIANARRLHGQLDQEVIPPLQPEDEQAWLRCLTDLRLTLAERLEITGDEPWGVASEADPSLLPALQVYDWLGAAQESLVVAVAGW
ncbi:DUF2017 family protein [Curtobacterium ammoniigenes]|uniref:DUF2017 family protein n=1 Tax=Curtobacterium ammoniigenes TaxID=395387 RepID=UPI00082E505B|nr:DUF2017 family protein [Curtobacterium ammoniigenes]